MVSKSHDFSTAGVFVCERKRKAEQRLDEEKGNVPWEKFLGSMLLLLLLLRLFHTRIHFSFCFFGSQLSAPLVPLKSANIKGKLSSNYFN